MKLFEPEELLIVFRASETTVGKQAVWNSLLDSFNL